MTTNIELSEATFARLQQHAVPFIDTPEIVIIRALDALEAGDEEPRTPKSDVTSRTFNPAAAPNLSHTSPRKVSIAGELLPKAETYWNPIMYAVIVAAAEKGTSSEDLMDLLTCNAVHGEKEDNGFRYLPEAGISVQGQDANSAWKQTHRIASSIGIEVEVTFIWQDNPKAAMPGTVGSMYVEG
jgi:hypothetical protein